MLFFRNDEPIRIEAALFVFLAVRNDAGNLAAKLADDRVR